MNLLRLFDPIEPTESAKSIVTVRDLFATYIERTGEGQSGDAVVERKRLLAEFCQVCGNVPISELIPDDLEGWIEGNASWKSDWTRMRVASTIKRPFGWACRKGLVARNPFASVAYSPGPRGKPMDDRVFSAFLRKSDALFRRVLMFMSWTGCRPCELSKLEWSMIDIQAGAAVLYLHKTARTRKDRAPRVIVLPAVAVRLLVWIRRQQLAGEKFVFLNTRHQAWTKGALDLRIYRLRNRLGVDPSCKLYGLRHRFATKLACAGVDLANLAAVLGHTNPMMSCHYIHLSGRTSHLREVVERGLK